MSSAFGTSSLFNNILLQVTNEKLNELKTQQNLVSAHFQPVLDSVGDAPAPGPALIRLYEAVRDSPIRNLIHEESTLLDTLRYFIAGMERDPSISEQIVGVWVEKLKQEIEYAIRKCEYSYLYGSLLSEWLDMESKQPQLPQQQGQEPESATAPVVGPTKDKALEELRALMFTPPATPFDKERFLAHLREQVFNVQDNAAHQRLLESIRHEIKKHFDVAYHQVHSHELRSCIDGLCSEDYVAQDKKTALRQLQENSEVLKEVASLLTNRIRHLHLWDWSTPNVHVNLELSRGLAGQWRGALSEDVITMLMLRYIGVEWGSKLKSVFLRIYDAMWKKPGQDKASSGGGGVGTFRPQAWSINSFRETNFRSSLLSELPDSMQSQLAKNPNEYVQVVSDSSFEEICEYKTESFGVRDSMQPPVALFGCSAQAPQMMAKRLHRGDDRRAPAPPQPHPPIDLRQSFLHVLSTEIKLSHTIRPTSPFVVVQSNFEQFAASLRHEPVLAILEFFHMPSTWLDFFAKFLRTPFENRIRVRGIPDSHLLAAFFGEVALFVLDFHINRATGISLYRVLDQFWLWGNDLEKVTAAWRIVEEFGSTLGLRVDAKKSGSIITYGEAKLAEFCTKKELEPEARKRLRIAPPGPLPSGSVRWAYLELASNGRFTIDQQALTSFTDEMKSLLEKAGCTLQYINVYNKYMEFFVRNFGRNALVFGDQHVEQIVDALRQIHEQLFGGGNGNVVQGLKAKFPLLAAREREIEIVDVWVYWPLERGGLGLVNPFLEIMALHATYKKVYPGSEDSSRELEFTPLLLQDKNNYDEHVRAIEERNKRRAEAGGIAGNWEPEKVPTFEVFCEERESGAGFQHWYQRYVKLLERPTALQPPTITTGGPAADAYYAVALVGDEAGNEHMQWVYTYYEPQLLRHFGTIQFINTALLPMSMIGNIRKSKVKH